MERRKRDRLKIDKEVERRIYETDLGLTREWKGVYETDLGLTREWKGERGRYGRR